MRDFVPAPLLILGILGVCVVGLPPIAGLFIGFESRSVGVAIVDASGLAFRSLPLLVSSSILAALLGALCAALVLKMRRDTQLAALLVLSVPLVLPSYVGAVAWVSFWETVTGTFIRSELGELWRHVLLVWIWVATWYPIALWLVWSAGRRSDPGWKDALQVSGRRFSPSLIRLQYGPAGLLSIAMVFAACLSDFAVPDYLRVTTFATLVFAEISGYYDVAGAIALSLPWLAFSSVLLFVALRNWSAMPLGMVRSQVRDNPHSYARVWVTIAVCVLVLAPVAALVTQIGGMTVLQSAAKLLVRDASSTAIVVLSVACICAILAWCLANGVRALPSFASKVVRPTLLAFWICPSALLALGAVAFWNREPIGWVYDTGIVLGLVLAAKSLWIGFEVAHVFFQQVPLSSDETHFVSGRSPTRLSGWRLGHGGLPWVALAAFGAAVIALGDLAIATLVGPAGLTTWSMRVFSTVHYGVASLIAALCLGQILILLMVFYGARATLIGFRQHA